ncbi:MAG TPA: AAC(3) family N-acetyltransferase [Microlunatus sp.]|nr:AAC(3) family N-acetyltransferase [Microlunatus sp.]
MSDQVDRADIAAGLARLGLDRGSSVVVHASLSSFGHVDGGAAGVVAALSQTCGTVAMMAGAGDLTGLPAPPGLVRPHNAYRNAASWDDFDRQVAAAAPYRPDLPVSRWLGRIAEELVRTPGAVRGPHPLYSFVAVGEHAEDVIAAERLDRQLGAIERLAELDGDVLLLGVDHSSDTTMHLAEQRFGRGHFFRYARDASGLWIELPGVSGESHRFDEIEPLLRPATRETRIGSCRARRIRIADVLEITERLLRSDPGALLCSDPVCRCVAALEQWRAR